MVEVGGGAPKPPDPEDASKDIRLGDIVVSNTKGNHEKIDSPLLSCSLHQTLVI